MVKLTSSYQELYKEAVEQGLDKDLVELAIADWSTAEEVDDYNAFYLPNADIEAEGLCQYFSDEHEIEPTLHLFRDHFSDNFGDTYLYPHIPQVRFDVLNHILEAFNRHENDRKKGKLSWKEKLKQL